MTASKRREKTVTEIASEVGVNRTTVWRRLRKIEAQEGQQVVARRGGNRKMVTTVEALEKVAAANVAPVPPPSEERINMRIAQLEARLRDAETRADGHARAFAEFRRKVRTALASLSFDV